MRALIPFFLLLINLNSSLEAKVFNLGVERLCPYYCDDVKRPGYIIELLDAYMKKRGDELKVSYLPFIRLTEFVKLGKIDLTLLPQYEIRFDSDLKSIGPALGISYMGVITNKKLKGPFIGVGDLTPYKTIIPKRGLEYNKIKSYFRNQQKEKSLLEITGEDSVERQFKMLQLGRVDIALGDYNIFKFQIKNQNLNSEIKLFASSIGGFHPITLVTSQNFSAQAEFEKSFTQFLAEMRTSNELSELLAKYNISDWQQLTP